MGVVRGCDIHDDIINKVWRRKKAPRLDADVSGYLSFDLDGLLPVVEELTEEQKNFVFLYILSIDVVFTHLFRVVTADLFENYVSHFFEKLVKMTNSGGVNDIDYVKSTALLLYTSLGLDNVIGVKNYVTFEITKIEPEMDDLDSTFFGCVDHRVDLFNHFSEYVKDEFDFDGLRSHISQRKVVYDRLSKIFKKDVALFLSLDFEFDLDCINVDIDEPTIDDNPVNIVNDEYVEKAVDDDDVTVDLIFLYYRLLFSVERERFLADIIKVKKINGYVPQGRFEFKMDIEDNVSSNRFFAGLKMDKDFDNILLFVNKFASNFDAMQMTDDSDHGIEEFDYELFDMFFISIKKYFKSLENGAYEDLIKKSTLIIITFSKFGDELAAYLLNKGVGYNRYD